MKRKLIIYSLLLLAMLVGFLGLGSYSKWPEIRWSDWMLAVRNGRFMIAKCGPHDDCRLRIRILEATPGFFLWGEGGDKLVNFFILRSTHNGRLLIYVHIIWWILFLIVTGFLLVAYSLPVVRRIWKKKRGLCVICGYSLHKNISGRCPECGIDICCDYGEKQRR